MINRVLWVRVAAALSLGCMAVYTIDKADGQSFAGQNDIICGESVPSVQACGSSLVPCSGRHCTSVFGEFLYLHPTGVDMVHAQQQNGIGGAGTVPFGEVGAIDPGYEPGLRGGINYALDPCSSIMLSFAYFESNAIHEVLPALIPGGGGAVGSLVHHPAAAITASSGPVTATYDIDYQLADVEYRTLISNCADYWINCSIGARLGHLEQDFFQTGVFSGGSAGVIQTRTGIEFDGGGLKFGGDGEYIVGCRGFSIYGKASVSPIVGQFSSRYTMNNASTAVLLADAFWKDDRFVTMLDYEVGIAWTSYNECWRFSAGYMASFWYNAVTTPEFVDAVQADNYVDLGDTISFDGLTARVEARW
ncbi:MAG: hypothetical protein JW829_15460 [Pirellulales bacterium]|nr:hypothetical protein [Pirellulales bacterium]